LALTPSSSLTSPHPVLTLPFPRSQQHDGHTLKEGEDIFVQAALLYTTAAGERRVRVHNLRLVATESVQAVFRHADVDAILSVLVRKGK
jgi:hypothetical protein